MSDSTVYVSYDGSTISFSPNNGDVTVDYGDGNTITFEQASGQSGWKFTEFSISPNPQGVFTWTVGDTQIDVTDNDNNSTANNKTYNYNVTVASDDGSEAHHDPKIINKPNG